MMNLVHVLLGIFLVIAAASAGESWPAPAGVAGYVAMLIFAVVGNYCLWFMVMCSAFWLEKVDALQEPYVEILNLSRYPPTVLPRPVRVAVTVLLPALVSAALPHRYSGAVSAGTSWGSAPEWRPPPCCPRSYSGAASYVYEGGTA